jgi:hypothetical protein
MKSAILISLTFLTGCIGDAALPIVSSTSIPGTNLTVDLGGPDRKGQYHYYVRLPDERYTYRFLGTLPTDQLKPATVESAGEGIFRIQWGTAPDSPYAIIDVKNWKIVEDSNKSNAMNTPFADIVSR